MTDRSVAAGDSVAHAARIKSREGLLEAAEAALAWFDRFEEHAPSGMRSFAGGEAKIRRGLREAIRASRAPASLAPDPQDYPTEADYELACAIHEEEARRGSSMTPRERDGFARGFLGARSHRDLLASFGMLKGSAQGEEGEA